MTKNRQPDSTEPQQQPKKNRGRRLNWILSFLLIIAIGTGGFWYWQYRNTLDKSPEAEQRRWTTELGSIMIMPNEQPLVTTVLDKSKLTNETLAQQAQNGDRLYIFSDAKRLVLYRPSDKKIVNVLSIQTP